MKACDCCGKTEVRLMLGPTFAVCAECIAAAALLVGRPLEAICRVCERSSAPDYAIRESRGWHLCDECVALAQEILGLR
jgi:hypothetical protein